MTTQITIDRAVVEQALGKIGKAYAKVSALCSGDERWTMSVPVRPDYDHDVVISDALNAASEALRAALAEQPAEHGPSAGGLLFAVEEAIRNGDCPWQIEQEFDKYEAERKAAIGIMGDV